jgi:SPP1 gp7 family putative phage head morphogenesis protein
MFEYSDKNIEALIAGIYNGSITEYDLPEALYNAIAKYFQKGLYHGFGMSLEDATGKDFELLTELRENIYMFSAAKTFQEVKQIGSLMIGEDGELRTAKEFNEVGREAFDLWNDVWGTTEYNTTVGQAQQASKWVEIEANKAILPNLRYSAIEDANTSPECAAMDGIVAPVDDPIWDANAPLQHFNCRCVLLQEDETVKTSSPETKGTAVDTVNEYIQPLFKMNAGKDGYIFKDDHPYFEVEKKDRSFARNNFGLKIPDNDE